jgi:hypothetical protein
MGHCLGLVKTPATTFRNRTRRLCPARHERSLNGNKSDRDGGVGGDEQPKGEDEKQGKGDGLEHFGQPVRGVELPTGL